MTAHFLIGKPGVTRLAGHGFVVFPSGWPRQNNTGTFPVDKPRYATSCVTGPKGISFAPFGKAGAVQAQNWDKPRRVISKIEWPPDELFPRVCLIVTNLPMEPDRLARFCNQPGTAEQHIKEGKCAFRWTWLSFKRFRNNGAITFYLAEVTVADDMVRANPAAVRRLRRPRA